MKPRRSIFMPVYNALEYDGRVQRTARALAGEGAVTVFALDAGDHARGEGYRVKRVKLAGAALRPALRYLVFCAALILAALRARPGLIYAHDYFTALPASFAARLLGAKLVYDAHELTVPGAGGHSSPRDALFHRLERVAIRRADLIVAANPERARCMRDYYGLSAQPLVVRNIPPPALAILGEAETLRRYPSLRRARSDAVRLVYQGDLSLARGLAPFIAALAHLPRRFELLLVGGGPESGREAIRGQIEQAGLGPRVIVLGLVPCDRLPDILALCDIGIVSYRGRTPNQIYCAPNKVFEYAQAGLPFVSTCQPPLEAIAEDYGVSIAVGCGEEGADVPAGEIARACRRIAERYQAFTARLPAFLADHRWEVEAAALREAVFRL